MDLRKNLPTVWLVIKPDYESNDLQGKKNDTQS